MRIHGNQANLNTINPYSAAAEKATAAQRAADVRKKLLKSASGIEGRLTMMVSESHGHQRNHNPRLAQPA
jgi:hypothetical protein